ncbi:hypothetical protein Poli38472_003787 [Pythium oligandrum]|uniref:Uncharacterized protein n=1 Tax=Pythium oligandrum TaxID=41045 RepID=A0A8K1CM26_PYTOL|nr:hypothetical protein Poli38472_003787 [Pythium oligandrum]|eukprot:TMW66022.1 hypothetical protein Poli38472_003787 [Pythium oligandrum]
MPPREVRSMSKFEAMRRDQHPLYRTTTGYDYGRHLEIEDGPLSTPKHARIAGFTQEFIVGPFHDSSLSSIDKSKQRAESWGRKVEERTKQMHIKYEELQERLSVKKEQRKREREARRRAMEQQYEAAVIIQAHVRGHQVRTRLRQERYERSTLAAFRIQQKFRSHAEVKRAQAVLALKKQLRLDGYASKLQRIGRQFLLRLDAQRQLAARRQERMAKRGSQRGGDNDSGLNTQDEAACIIQRIMRKHVSQRRVNRQFSARSTASSSTGSDHKDGRDNGLGAGGAIHALRATKQKIARRAIVTMKQRKREKSTHRLTGY